jgi:ubiquinone/menaquinone biosynthesis C-methylase UbiE
MEPLKQSWSAIGEVRARTFLREEEGKRESHARRVLAKVLKEAMHERQGNVLDVGCGNGNLAPLVRKAVPNATYTGVDISSPLLRAARETYPFAQFIENDCETLDSPLLAQRSFDVVVYSHVIEMLESPERSLAAARRMAPAVVIEFFEPPSNRPDKVELLTMDNGQGPVPYLRRSTSIGVYSAWVSAAGFSRVDRYFTKGKYEVHLLR